MKQVFINIEDNPSFLNSFLDYTATILNKSQNTVKEYNYDLNTFLKYIVYHFKMTDEKDITNIDIANMTINTVSRITLDDIYSFLFYLTQTHHCKATTRARKIASIRVFFKFLCNKQGLIEKNPAQNLETPKLEKRIPKYLTLEDSKNLLIATKTDYRNKERDYAIITLFLNCGMRLAELVNINLKDINYYDQKLNIIGKGNKERTIYLNQSCIDALDKYIKVRANINSEDALFLSEQRKRISRRTVQYIVKRELQRAGLDTKKYSVHKLRHTAATLMYKYGNIDIRVLQEILGHENVSTTQIYTHVDNIQLRNAIECNPLANIC